MWLSYMARRALRSLGYDIRRVAAPENLAIEPEGSDPVTADYSLSKRGYAIFDVAVEDARAFHAMGLRLTPEHHPFVRAFALAKDIVADRDARRVIRRCLEEYYDRVEPSTALDVMGLAASDAPGFRDVTPSGYLLPWSDGDINAMIRGREKAIRYVGIRYGIGRVDDAGYPFFGPLADQRIELQVERLARLRQLVRENGFKPFSRDFPIKVTALRKDGAYRWLVEEGQHRFAIAGALGVATIPSMLISVIRREDAALWPKVALGSFTEKGALRLFDRIYEGKPPASMQHWITPSERASST